jgi:O-antigen/teichoic acid export membrane protein
MVVPTVIGQDLMEAVFGAGFRDFADLLVPLGVSLVFGGWISSASVALKVARLGRRLAAAQVPAVLTKVVLCAVLAQSNGVVGAAWGLAVGSGVHALLLWLLLVRGVYRTRSSSVAASTPATRPQTRVGGC